MKARRSTGEPARPADEPTRSAAMHTVALDVRDVTVAYGGSAAPAQTAVSGAGFTLEPGRILGLAGESGCGKSTLALAAIGYRPPGGRVLAGSARLGDTELFSLPTAELRRLWGARIAYVAQSAAAALNPAIAVGRQLAQVLETHLCLRDDELHAAQLELFAGVGCPTPRRLSPVIRSSSPAASSSGLRSRSPSRAGRKC